MNDIEKDAEARTALEEMASVVKPLIICAYYNTTSPLTHMRLVTNRKAKKEFDGSIWSSEWTKKVTSSIDEWPEARNAVVDQMKAAMRRGMMAALSSLLTYLFMAKFYPADAQLMWPFFLFWPVMWILCPMYEFHSDFAAVRKFDKAQRRWQQLQLPTSSATVKPPAQAEYLLWLMFPGGKPAETVGHLNEQYVEACERFGEFRAKVWYWWQVLRSTGPLLGRLIDLLLRYWIPRD